MKKTRKSTTVSCVAAVVMPFQPAQSSCQMETCAGESAAGAGVAADALGAAGLPVSATLSISAAAFFTSVIWPAGLRAMRCTVREMLFAASGTFSRIACASSAHAHAPTHTSPTNPTTMTPAESHRKRSTRVAWSTSGASAYEIISATKSGMKNGAP